MVPIFLGHPVDLTRNQRCLSFGLKVVLHLYLYNRHEAVMLQCWLFLLKFRQMAPLYEITLLNLVLIGMFSIYWP